MYFFVHNFLDEYEWTNNIHNFIIKYFLHIVTSIHPRESILAGVAKAVPM